jgi:SH3-like domain-containing protein
MLISLMVASLLWQAGAETTSAPLSNVIEPATGAPRRGILTLMSNLRTSPSTRSEIVAIAKEGTLVEILAQTERWYRVRRDDGVEAWIYKPLVHIEREPSKEPSAAPAALAQPDTRELSSGSAANSDIFAEARPANAAEQHGSVASPAAPVDEQHVSPEATGTGWFIDAILPAVQGLEAYIIIALVVVLVLSIALQLRAAGQLRRAMREMGQILDLVEEIYAGGASTRTRHSGVPISPAPPEASTHQPQLPMIEFSPMEHAMLEALSDQHALQEGELGKVLDEKGFAGMLIKAVIGDIVRKTSATGLPWVEVRYAQDRYSYRLRPEAAPNLRAQREEKR